MNTLLVYPQYPNTYWSFKHVLKYVRKKAAYPPLGLLTIAPLLPQEWPKKLVDMNVRPLTEDDWQWAEVVMVSAMIVQRESTRKVLQQAKTRGKITVVGGPLFATVNDLYDLADHIVVGEAEELIDKVIANLVARGSHSSALSKPQIYVADERPEMKLVPLPDWSLIDLREYATMPLQYSRGCPFDCEFCDIITIFGRLPRTKSPAQVLAELEALYKAGWRGSVFFVDDNFIGNKLKVKQMLLSVIDWQRTKGYPFRFITEASVNLAADEELMILMQQANFYKVFLGIESPDEASLRECGKVQNIEVRHQKVDLGAVVKIIHQHGMQVMGGFIVGFDSDDEGVFHRQIKWIQDNGVVQAMVGILTALPGTQLWHRLDSEGRLLGQGSGNNTGIDALNFIPKLDPEILRRGLRYIQNYIYKPAHYYARIRIFLRYYQPTVRGGISFNEMIALFKSMFLIGIASPSRWEYWKLFFSTLFTRVKKFPVAIELAIFGEHYRRHAQELVV